MEENRDDLIFISLFHECSFKSLLHILKEKLIRTESRTRKKERKGMFETLGGFPSANYASYA